MSKIINREISDYLSTEYKNYAMYVIESRAVPSVTDGFKNVQRKIVDRSRKNWKNMSEKSMKVFQLSGDIAKNNFYHHGDASLNGAIISMAQKFKNNLPLLEEVGQFGSLRSPSAGAPRYVGTKLSENFNLVYKDFDLLTPKFEEGYEIEPEFFLPIIPMVLINGGQGIAVGYVSNILNRNPKEVITSCLNYLNGKKLIKIKPNLNEFNGKYIIDKENNNRWIVLGDYEVLNTSTLRITELPPNMTYEKWENHLDKLVDERKIKSYEDNSKDGIDYTIKMSREDLEKLDDNDIISLFKLSETISEFFTTLDEKGKLKIFDSAEDIVKYFVDFRLIYYSKRKDLQIEKLNSHIQNIDNRIKFIQAILEEKIVVNKKSKEDIIKQIIKVGITKRDDSYYYLLSMPIHSLSKERWDEMKQVLKDKKEELKIIKATVPKDVYIAELEELKNKL